MSFVFNNLIVLYIAIPFNIHSMNRKQLTPSMYMFTHSVKMAVYVCVYLKRVLSSRLSKTHDCLSVSQPLVLETALCLDICIPTSVFACQFKIYNAITDIYAPSEVGF